MLPTGWEDRLVVVETPQTNGYRGLCLSPGDLAASKLAAGREKDLDFVRAMLRDRLVTAEDLNSRIDGLSTEHVDGARRLMHVV